MAEGRRLLAATTANGAVSIGSMRRSDADAYVWLLDNAAALLDAAEERASLNSQLNEWMSAADDRWIALNAALARESKLREGLQAALADEPLIVHAIRRDLELTPDGRAGEIRFTPATPGRGASGCPGDNLLAWLADLRALLSPEDQS